MPTEVQAQVWKLKQGLTVAYERRQGPSFAFNIRLPWGSAHDPMGQEGSASLLEEWWYKGAGGRNARELLNAFDDLGVLYSGGTGREATHISVSGWKEDLPAALRLVADMLLRPQLLSTEVPVLLDLARQDLADLEDSPTSVLSSRAREFIFPRKPGDPSAGFAHSVSGTVAGLNTISAESLRAHFVNYGQVGSLLGLVADWSEQDVQALVSEIFSEWQSGLQWQVPAHFQAKQTLHVSTGTGEQTHMMLVAPAPAVLSKEWLPWQIVLNVLSGGSSSRLFQTVREDLGLAYEVSASPLIRGGQSFFAVYAGTTPQRASQTIDVILRELERLGQGISATEFTRAQFALISDEVFEAEALSNRAYALTRDLALYGRIDSVTSVRAKLEELTLDQVNLFLRHHHLIQEATLVTLGPKTSNLKVSA